MTAKKPEDVPGVVSAEQGQIILDGPDGVAVSMTPAAAVETGHRLVAAAKAATDAEKKDGASDTPA